jgi:hypothetical protein
MAIASFLMGAFIFCSSLFGWGYIAVGQMSSAATGQNRLRPSGDRVAIVAQDVA